MSKFSHDAGRRRRRRRRRRQGYDKTLAFASKTAELKVERKRVLIEILTPVKIY